MRTKDDDIENQHNETSHPATGAKANLVAGVGRGSDRRGSGKGEEGDLQEQAEDCLEHHGER